MKLVATIVIAMLVVNALAILGVLGYGMATGRLDAQWREQYLATWRGETLVPPPEEEAVEIEEAPREASGRIAEAEVERMQFSREVQMQVQLLRDMEFALKAAQAKLDEQRQGLLAERRDFELAVQAYEAAAEEEGFRKALARYSEMKSSQVKEDFMAMTDEQMTRFIAEMKVDVAKKILEQFKTPEEQAKRQRVMQLLESYQQVEPQRLSASGGPVQAS